MSNNQDTNSLSERLLKICECPVCFETSFSKKSYSCIFGHIACETCMLRIFADAILERQEASCPTCRVTITWNRLNLCTIASEVVALLPKICSDCGDEFSFGTISNHKANNCPKAKPVECQWIGAESELAEHKENCEYSKKGGSGNYEVIYSLREWSHSFEFKLTWLKQYDSFKDSFLFVPNGPFTAFGLKWKLTGELEKRNLNSGNVRNVHKVIMFKLNCLVKSKVPLTVHFFFSSNDVDITERLYASDFSGTMNTASRSLLLNNSDDAYRFLVLDKISIKIHMFIGVTMKIENKCSAKIFE